MSSDSNIPDNQPYAISKAVLVLAKLKKWMSNPYIAILSFFIVWVGFIDQNSFLLYWECQEDIHDIRKSIDEYDRVIAESKVRMLELRSNKENLEKFAREQYFMKKDNEDIYKFE